MTKKIICLTISIIMLFSLTACGDMQSKLDEMQKRIDRQDNKISDLENENELKDGKIADLEQELQDIKTANIKDDFVLTVKVNSAIVSQGNMIKVDAVLYNQSGKGQYIKYTTNLDYTPGYWTIPGWWDENRIIDVDQLDPAPPMPSCFVYFGNSCSIPFSYTIPVENQETGLYELEIGFEFILYDVYISDEEIYLWDFDGVPMALLSDKIAIWVALHPGTY